MIDEGEKLLLNLQTAFDRSAAPAKPIEFIEFSESEAAEETERFWGKSWQELSLVDFDNNSRAFSFFPEKDLMYFAGALMWLTLKAEDAEISGDLIWSWLQGPIYGKHNLAPMMARHLKGLSDFQASTFVEFLIWYETRTFPELSKAILEFLRHYAAGSQDGLSH